MALSNDLTNDIVKALTDPKPLYAAAGASDLALERLREVPEKLSSRGIPAQEQVAGRLSEAVGEIRGLLSNGDLGGRVSERVGAAATSVSKAASSESLRALPEKAQHFALRQVGLAAEAVAKAGDTYDELAVRGRLVVDRLRSSRTGSAEGATVTVEVVDDSATPEAGGSARTSAPRGSATAKARAARAAAKAAAEDEAAEQPEPKPRTSKPRTVKPQAAKTTGTKTAAPKADAPKAGAPKGASAKAQAPENEAPKASSAAPAEAASPQASAPRTEPSRETSQQTSQAEKPAGGEA